MATQGLKRSAPEAKEVLEDVKAIVVDVEGATTPNTFVQDVLLPYIKENIQSYLNERWEEDECKSDVKALREQATTDQKAEVEGAVAIAEGDDKDAVIASLVASVGWQMESCRKNSALSQLQGHMWHDAYKSGKIQGRVFEDVAPAVREWVSEKRKVYAFSTGSVEAQKLMFTNSSCGNIGDLFSGHFDTTTGKKEEKDSYKKIATELSLDPAEILFLTDKPTEAGPAAEAGLKTSLVAREGAQLTDDDKQKFNVIDTFSELTSATNGSAKRVEQEEEGAGDAEQTDNVGGDTEQTDAVDGTGEEQAPTEEPSEAAEETSEAAQEEDEAAE